MLAAKDVSCCLKVKDGELIDLGCLSYHNNLCTGWFRAGMN